MVWTEQDGVAEKQKAEELIASVPRMPEVEHVSVRLDTDWTGDPSLVLIFHIRHDAVVDDAFAAKYVDYTSQVQDKILQSGVSRFPYTRVKRAA